MEVSLSECFNHTGVQQFQAFKALVHLLSVEKLFPELFLHAACLGPILHIQDPQMITDTERNVDGEYFLS